MQRIRRGEVINSLRIIITILILNVFTHLRSIAADIDIFMTGVDRYETEKHVGVVGACYLLSPVGDEGTFLSFQSGSLHFRKGITKEALFSFERIEECLTHYSLRNVISPDVVQDKARQKDKCFIRETTSNEFQLVFKEHYGDRRPSLLKYTQDRSKVVVTGVTADDTWADLWTLRPYYAFSGLESAAIDSETLLFKIPKQEGPLGKTLSARQVLALYDLYGPREPTKKLTFVHQGEGFVFAQTPQLPYLAGLYITSGDSPLRLYNLKGCIAGEGESSEQAKGKAGIVEEEDYFDLRQGRLLFISLPPYPGPRICIDSFPIIFPLGNIEITPGCSGWFFPSYKGLRVKLGEIIHRQGLTLFPDFAVRSNGKTVSFLRINKNLLLSPGTAIFLTQYVTQDMLDKIHATGTEVADRLARGVENFGMDIERASKNASAALIKSSSTLSAGLVECTGKLAGAVDNASRVFQESVRLLCGTAQEISADAIGALDKVSMTLKAALVEASGNLREGAADISDALITSSQSFEKAFGGIARAMREGSGDIAGAIEEASKNFVAGMGKIEEAAKRLQQTEHSVTICSVM